MAYSGLQSFAKTLEQNDELRRIRAFCDPELEIAEITDRVFRSGTGKALLFENTGTRFPVLMNAFGSGSRLTMALGGTDPSNTADELARLFGQLTSSGQGLLNKLTSLPLLFNLSSVMPSRKNGKGACQSIINHNPDLTELPILKCWPYDGGKFITLPLVHTVHPSTGKYNLGMYRMQVLTKNTTGMHWQRHKTGANHYDAWKREGRRMPVTVTLGGDPVYTWAATAPLPENIDEYILAGFLRKRKVKLVKCITNELYVPEDSDFVIEGYVDPAENPVWEGPFGDHTGFYSLADWYPIFHVTCITHRENAIYPATIVGVPPQEDVFLAEATEKIFLAPVRLTIAPEVIDFHMPAAGVAHNLVIVKINKSYPGQGMKVVNSLLGAGQMMFSKYIVAVSGNVDIRNYRELFRHVTDNLSTGTGIIFTKGPLDVLDHASDTFSYGGKAGIDATIKMPEEQEGIMPAGHNDEPEFKLPRLEGIELRFAPEGFPVVLAGVDSSADEDAVEKVKSAFRGNGSFRLVVAVDIRVDLEDLFMVCWQVLGNTDPARDCHILSKSCLFIDGTVKAFRKGGFPRKWPNVVSSDVQTIENVDRKWNELGIGAFIPSPSLRYGRLAHEGREEVNLKKHNI